VTPASRRVLIGLAVAGLVGMPLLIAGYFSLGLIFAPPWPVPATGRHVTPLIADALWARANGGANTEINPLAPANLAQLAVCIAQAEREDPGPLRDDAQAECRRRYAPAFEAVEYVSELHLRAAGFERPGFRKGHAKFVTTIWLMRSWTWADLLATLVEHGEFGMGFRGIERAAHGYFGRTVEQLTLPQAAMIAALVGDRAPDPWCDAASAATRRHRVLSRMYDNHAISEEAFSAADRSELGLSAPPAGHDGCER